jgi:hypothetical protein
MLAVCNTGMHMLFGIGPTCGSARGAVSSLRCSSQQQLLLQPVMDVAPDDVLRALFATLASDWSDASSVTPESYSSFIWFRTSIPLVCCRWRQLLLQRSTAWHSVTVLPRAEAVNARRQYRSEVGAAGDSPRAASPPIGSPLGPPPPLLGASPQRNGAAAHFDQVAGTSPAGERMGGGYCRNPAWTPVHSWSSVTATAVCS